MVKRFVSSKIIDLGSEQVAVKIAWVSPVRSS